MTLSLIAAVAENGVIGGIGGGIPWNLAWDTRHFREYTRNKWMLLGRKTYREMDGWFTTQKPIVLSSQSRVELFDPRHRVASSLEDALDLAGKEGAEELVVSGGASLYDLALPRVEKILITRVKCSPEGDAFFPELDTANDWITVHREFHPADAENSHDAGLEILVRRKE